MQTKEQMISRLESMRDRARKQIDTFAEEIKGDNPAYYFSWGASQFISAAEFEFAKGWLNFFVKDNEEGVNPVEVMLNAVQRVVLEKSRSVANKSTSVTSNYMDDCTLEVYARFIDDCRY